MIRVICERNWAPEKIGWIGPGAASRDRSCGQWSYQYRKAADNDTVMSIGDVVAFQVRGTSPPGLTLAGS